MGPGVSMGSYPFPFEIKFFQYPCENPFFESLETKFRFPVWTVYCPQKNCEYFLSANKNSGETHYFFRLFKTVISSTNSGSHCLSRKCRTYTFNNFLPAKWESRNGGDLFGRAKINTAKSCIQLLQIVLLYRGQLHKELRPVIFRYSKEWKSITIDIVQKSA